MGAGDGDCHAVRSARAVPAAGRQPEPHFPWSCDIVGARQWLRGLAAALRQRAASP